MQVAQDKRGLRRREIWSAAADEVNSGGRKKTGDKLADVRAAIGLTSTKNPSTKFLDLAKRHGWD